MTPRPIRSAQATGVERPTPARRSGRAWTMPASRPALPDPVEQPRRPPTARSKSTGRLRPPPRPTCRPGRPAASEPIGRERPRRLPRPSSVTSTMPARRQARRPRGRGATRRRPRGPSAGPVRSASTGREGRRVGAGRRGRWSRIRSRGRPASPRRSAARATAQRRPPGRRSRRGSVPGESCVHQLDSSPRPDLEPGRLVAEAAQDLDPLDRVDPEVGLEVEVEPEHLGGIAGPVADDLQQPRGDRRPIGAPRRCAVARGSATVGRRCPSGSGLGPSPAAADRGRRRAAWPFPLRCRRAVAIGPLRRDSSGAGSVAGRGRGRRRPGRGGRRRRLGRR